jgi:hypothetical protein
MKMNNIRLEIHPLVLVLLAASVGFLAAKASPHQAQQYDYVSLVQVGNRLYTTMGARLDTERYPQHPQSDALLFEKMAVFEAQGYALVTSNYFAGTTTNNLSRYVLMRRPK